MHRTDVLCIMLTPHSSGKGLFYFILFIHLFIFSFYFIKDFIYLFEIESEHERRREAEGEADSPLSKVPDAGLDSRTLSSWPQLKEDA